MGLLDVERFLISRGHLRDIQSALQDGGVRGEERFVLLSGSRRRAGEVLIKSVVVPDQTAGTHERGMSITVGGDELARLNRVWSERHEQLLAQVHSHPTFPFHSSVDSRYSIATLEGSLSIVVPNFGFCDMTNLRSCAVYRIVDGQWCWLPPRLVDALVAVI
jgi:hypothetical protein